MQYRTSAALTLSALRDESLQWIALVDPDAGTLDDFQLARRGRLDAYQIKFSGASGGLTFTRLKNVIGELAEGWDRLRRTHPDREVFAHLHTSRPASRHGPAGPVGQPKPPATHFAAFLEAVWQPVQSGAIRTTTAIPTPWQPVWEVLRSETPFAKRDFLTFIRHLLLDLGQQVPDPDVGDLRVDPDLKQRFQQLLWVQEEIVRDPNRSRVARSELLQELGWTADFEFRSVHEFAIRRDRYVPIVASASALLSAIHQLPGGYVAVVGTPGSGKSTLLTDTFYGHSDVVARYYAYVPDNEVGRLTRASATNFLHDIVLSLDRAGIQVGRTPVSFDIEVLAERLRRQLRALGDRFSDTGEPGYIVIDGLDHVERAIRAEARTETLLDRLPDPAEIPDGVFLVVGTQRTDVAPEPVRTQLTEPGRVVQMSPLQRADVVRLASDSGVAPEGAEELLYTISGGHPLIVGYLLSGLEGVPESDRRSWLNSMPRVEGDVLALYRAYWTDIEADDETVYALAHIARWRGAIDLEWFATWLNPVAIQRIRRTAQHFFRRERVDRWYFFHESFRVFLLDTTIQSGTGVTDERIALRYHLSLANACAQAEHERLHWEQLHHLIEAGADEAALELATPATFRAQAQALRALPAIDSDIREATRAAVRQCDITALTRLMIASSELNQREYHLGWSDNLALLLIDLDEVEIALEHLRGDYTLRESKDVALSAATDLFVRGFEVEARRLFDLAEPLDLLRNQPEHYRRADAEVETLFAWAEAAPQFVPLERVIEQIAEIGDENFGHRWRGEADVARHYRAQLRAVAGIGALAAGDTDAVDALVTGFDLADRDEATAWGRLVLHRFMVEREQNADAARTRLEGALAAATPSQLAPSMRVRIGETLFRLDDAAAARHWVVDAQPPAMPEDASGGEGASRFTPILHYYRLCAALGAAVAPDDAVGEPRNSYYTLVHDGWRAIVRLANLWGAAVRGEAPTTDDAVAQLRSVVAMLDRRPSRDDLGWYAFQTARPALLAFVVSAASAARDEVLEEIKQFFCDRWLVRNPPDDEEVRRVLMAFLDLLGPENWIGEELARHEPTMFDGKDVNGQINAAFAQARAWLDLGVRDRAMQNALTGVNRAGGVGYRKDYQLNDWIELMAPLLREPDGGDEIIWMAQMLHGLDESTEGRAGELAAEELLRQTATAHPRTAVRLLRTLPRQDVLGYAAALAAFLEGSQPNSSGDLPWICLSEVLVARATSSEPAALRALTAWTNSESLQHQLLRLSKRVAVHALPTSRLYWRRTIADIASDRGLALEDVGLAADDLEPSERAPSSHREEPSNSEGSPADDVTTVTELLALVEDGDTDDYRLRAAVERLAEVLDADDAARLRHAFAGSTYEALILASLARRLNALGDRETARAVAEDALAAGRPSGWVAYIDGGTRIRPLQALAEIDPADARDRLWESLASDAADDGFNVGALLDAFPSLVTIADPGRALDVAREACAYAHVLLGSVKSSEVSDVPDLSGGDLAAACAWVLVDNALHGGEILGDAGARGVVQAVASGDEHVIEQLRASATIDPPRAQRALQAVAAAALTSESTIGLDEALQEIALAAGESDSELLVALRSAINSQAIETAQLEQAGVALALLVHRPSERPAEIGGAATRDVRDDQWLKGVTGAARQFPAAADGAVVLAELTSLSRLSWDIPTLRREQAAVRQEIDDRLAVPFLMNIPMLHYHDITDDADVVADLTDAVVFHFTEPGDEPWLSLGAAFNPVLAADLGWQPSNGLFAWQDDEGRPTCWSAWWRDGNRSHRPPSFDDVVGEGWLVLASESAVAAIERAIGPMERIVTVIHTISYHSETKISRVPLIERGEATTEGRQ